MFGAFRFGQSYFADSVGSSAIPPSPPSGGGGSGSSAGGGNISHTYRDEDKERWDKIISDEDDFLVIMATQFIANNQ